MVPCRQIASENDFDLIKGPLAEIRALLHPALTRCRKCTAYFQFDVLS